MLMGNAEISKAIESLRMRAKRAEHKSLIFMIILGAISIAAVSLILYFLFQNRSNNRPQADAYIDRFFGQMMQADFAPSDIV